jgi:hypothetical protein
MQELDDKGRHLSMYFDEAGLDSRRSNQKKAPNSLPNAILSIATVVTACATVALMFVTYRINQATLLSAEAARQSVELTQEAQVLLQRPFVFHQFDFFPRRAPSDTKVKDLRIRVSWLNKGVTPARNLSVIVNARIFEGEVPQNWNFHLTELQRERIQTEPDSNAVLGPDRFIYSFDENFPVEVLNDLVSGKKSLYFWGMATYRSILPHSKTFLTRFAVRIMAEKDLAADGSYTLRDRMLPIHNCIDEECDSQGYPETWIAPDLMYEEVTKE